MCDPVTIIGTALGAATALFGNNKDKAPEPPPVVKPAIPQPTAREPGADVKIGDTSNTSNSTTPEYKGFTEKRTTSRPLGGLGRGGLGL